MQIPHTAINSKLDRPAYMLSGYSRGNHRMSASTSLVNGLLALHNRHRRHRHLCQPVPGFLPRLYSPPLT